jgi:hypothetical protein
LIEARLGHREEWIGPRQTTIAAIIAQFDMKSKLMKLRRMPAGCRSTPIDIAS